jgi:hypothetical protein
MSTVKSPDWDTWYKQQAEEAEAKLRAAGHKPENTTCNHEHWTFDKYGRYCTCGTIMLDLGD